MDVYNFKNLSKLIEDVKFLMASGGDIEKAKSRSILKLIIKWLWIFVQIVLVYLVIYTIYKILTGGYSRFLMDILSFRFSNKLNLNKEFGDTTNGIFFKHIVDMFDTQHPNGWNFIDNTGSLFRELECESDNAMSSRTAENIFRTIIDTIEQNYEPIFKYEKGEKSLHEYYVYHDIIKKLLTSKNVYTDQPDRDIQEMCKVVNEYVYDVLGNYKTFLLKIQKIVNGAACKDIVTGATDGIRERSRQQKEITNQAKKDFFKQYNIVAVRTNKLFAEYLGNYEDIPVCSSSIDDLYKKYLRRTSHERLRVLLVQLKRHMKIDKERLRTIGNLKETQLIKKRIDQNLQQQKQTLLNMAMIREDVLKKAEIEYKRLQVSINQKIKPKQSSIKSFIKNFNGKRGVLNYEDDGFTTPNMEKSSKETFIVYIPCFELYRHYYNVNIKSFTSLEKTQLGEDEKIAYIFLQDVEDYIFNDTSILQRIFINFWMYEQLSFIVSKSLKDVRIINAISACSNIYFNDETKIINACQEVVGSKNEFMNAYRQGALGNFKVQEKYTFYLLELLYTLCENSNIDIYETFKRQFENIATYNNADGRKQSLLVFLNLSHKLQEDEVIRAKFNITDTIYNFMTRHPIFISLYLSSNASNETEKKNSFYAMIRLLKSVISSSKDLEISLLFPEKYNVDGLKKALNYTSIQIGGIKRTLITLQIVDMYLNKYKNELDFKGTKTNNTFQSFSQFTSKVGYKTLSNEQVIVDYNTFFRRLFQPFYVDFIEGRIFAAWKRAHSNPNWWHPEKNIEFKSYYIDYLGQKMKSLKDRTWKEVGKFTQPRWGKKSDRE